MDEFETKQMKKWTGDFGKEYTDRNALSSEEVDLLYKRLYGTTRTEMNYDFFHDLDKDLKILEVGSNVGDQLILLQKLGFNNLFGVELQSYAVELSKSRTKGINIVHGSAFDIPFKDLFFDIVFTSGVLIHISPDDIETALDEIYRCSNRYIWCFEYYAPNYTQINYRGRKGLLWKTDFSKLFLVRFSRLKLVRQEFYKYRDSDNEDVMFLLEKDK
jgi:pseudaminic acid biosynthesis-associated methylase